MFFMGTTVIFTKPERIIRKPDGERKKRTLKRFWSNAAWPIVSTTVFSLFLCYVYSVLVIVVWNQEVDYYCVFARDFAYLIPVARGNCICWARNAHAQSCTGTQIRSRWTVKWLHWTAYPWLWFHFPRRLQPCLRSVYVCKLRGRVS